MSLLYTVHLHYVTAQNHNCLFFVLFSVPIAQKSTDHAFPALLIKEHLIAASKSEATSSETLKASGHR